MDVISLTGAKAQLGALIDHVEAGGSIVITRHGKPVALLTAPTRTRKPIDVERLRALTDSMPLASQSAQDLVRSMRDDEDDDFSEKLIARRGSIDPDVDLEF
jgi:prevent-host-death family protein